MLLTTTAVFCFCYAAVTAEAVITDEPGVVEGKLIFAHVIFRHGNRTPIMSYPTDPWRDRYHWPNGWGQLTNLGKRTQYDLGRWLRKRYHHLLGDLYSPDEIYVQSTDADRVITSAQVTLAGLYPPTGRDVWHPNIAWQPVPVHVLPRQVDNLLAVSRPCPAFEEKFLDYQRSEEFQRYNRTIGPALKYMAEHSKSDMSNFLSAYYLYSCLDVEQQNGFRLPNWTKQVYPEPLKTISAELFKLKTATRPLARFTVGPLLKEILTRFQQKVSRTLDPNRSVWIYSGHDITIVNLLNGLGLFQTHNPPFGACIMIELRTSPSGTPYVSVFYRDSQEEPEALYIPGCGTRCPLRRMVQFYENIIPDDWERECRNV
ncbi:testicular acid phosphatase homolog [Culex quinquefasciatus]|uniref:testicular acid phosphatase homolog n=1 Tax=Culex quinquefasciatus TaxID=7176 RepID=UPI0018E344CC|nr:testicular acid phosphatase homolog [Culex quinquefasciatus]